jgi:restriction system protein
MAVPDYQTIMLPLLRFCGQSKGNEVAHHSAIDALAKEFKLSEEDRRQLLPSGRQFTFDNRVGWAATYMRKANLLESTRRAHYRITRRGLDVLKKNLDRIDVRFLQQFPEFIEFRNLSGTRPAKDHTSELELTQTSPEELLESAYQTLRDELASQLLERIKKCTPAFFERLIVHLLVRMGYGGTLKDAGMAVGKTGDGGIDGVIKEDKLGLENIYVQAKRWQETPVGTGEIDRFVGALQKKKANKGIFITASRFSKDALESLRDYHVKIILVDGPQLAQLMIDHNVGVSLASSYEVKKIDSDYFEEAAQ